MKTFKQYLEENRLAKIAAAAAIAGGAMAASPKPAEAPDTLMNVTRVKQDSNDKTVPYDPSIDDGLHAEEGPMKRMTPRDLMQRYADSLSNRVRPMQEIGLGDAPPTAFKFNGPNYGKKEAQDMRNWVHSRNAEHANDYKRELSMSFGMGYHGSDLETLIKGSAADSSVLSQLDPKRRRSFEYPSDILRDPIGIKRMTDAMNPRPGEEVGISDISRDKDPLSKLSRDPFGIERAQYRDWENYRRKEYYATKNNPDAVTLSPTQFSTKYGLRQPAKTEKQMLDKIDAANDQVWDDYENYEKERTKHNISSKDNTV
jgi:hypothetical protein